MSTKKREKLFDKPIQVSERTDPEYPDKATKQTIKAYKACKGKKKKEDFIKNLSPEERRVLRRWGVI
jgi:hypothetical protein